MASGNENLLFYSFYLLFLKQLLNNDLPFMKIAILDDNVHLAKSIKKSLTKKKNTIDLYHTRDSFIQIQELNYDVYILDIWLEDGNGLDIARYLRETKEIQAPILIISGYEWLQKKLEGFKIWIDDYLVKPFSPLELEARIASIIKKMPPLQKESFHYKNITFDSMQRKIFVDKKEIELPKKEKKILEFFLQNQDTFISKEFLIEKIWGLDYNKDKINNTLNVAICNIRKKAGSNFFLETINWEGYILRNTPGLDEKITLNHIITNKE